MVSIEELIYHFNQSLRVNDHILTMLKEPIRIRVELEQNLLYFTLDRKKLLIKHTRPLKSYHIHIQTTANHFYPLLQGRTSLKKKVDEKHIILKSTFRQLLKLDAIFLLNQQ
ncbi:MULTISPECIES: hypothetical protein [Cytobacillus]|uniref:SCP2 domain-containing protein n=1 Tax=Cytobacillus stercorigallinarum TaxID=2762240 RepID=A0ABR8QV42_9BACI|nr:hypothetical protein [Cytobacillus stercorigallinarum]MBD7939409.1 hypothetical protein [Cytobacillus stercorigallinarum]